VFADFKAQGDLIADFSIDGNRMKNRVILGSNKTFPLGDLATARLIGSYKFSSDGSLGIFLEVSAKANVTFGWDSDAYVGPNGAQVVVRWPLRLLDGGFAWRSSDGRFGFARGDLRGW